MKKNNPFASLLSSDLSEGYTEKEAEEYAKKHNGQFMGVISFYKVWAIPNSPSIYTDYKIPIESSHPNVEYSNLICKKCNKNKIEKRLEGEYCATCLSKSLE